MDLIQNTYSHEIEIVYFVHQDENVTEIPFRYEYFEFSR